MVFSDWISVFVAPAKAGAQEVAAWVSAFAETTGNEIADLGSE
jgi:hypothetical protein